MYLLVIINKFRAINVVAMEIIGLLAMIKGDKRELIRITTCGSDI